MRTVLFVCVENSFRSQIAEAYFNKYAPAGWRAVSAGSAPAEKIHPNAVSLMAEEGIDISGQRPKPLKRELQEEAEVAIIMCGGSSCPVVYSRKVERWDMPDPSLMPIDEARKIRDAIKTRVLELIDYLSKTSSD